MANKKKDIRDLLSLIIVIIVGLVVISSDITNITKIIILLTSWIIYSIITKDSWYY